ncbi:ECM14 (YHR132C) [Zygosaccharomyces parabailii]|uniref:Inactive metallocarboxypeptidase ECM14 n=1 Tax=Zygosaccharomyces bailii (strain CLIB 213 / ATCC 58445 / CBS 680 / BCRC 21525 / NBRC 1098 / NCYC 1416 / NRRL Y-2227) TaxID=1333698 RepID=A0A8J2T5G0_ZYGB2|nr:ECM14 (YHR132C) [Zygosaccharomyces parabailii]CDF88624.1 BN860_14598g1_1 [Zygosaccharomyces bailii CLIB 213]CDH14499.1 related to metallocarboxypeptidase ECM14 [Zygosaccharomyces bailii ISA1307]SJM82442.1 probable Putative metallocarboxypeptidase ECM14 [Zygosaccharomyces bailii]
MVAKLLWMVCWTILMILPHAAGLQRGYRDYRVCRFTTQNRTEVIDYLAKQVPGNYDVWARSSEFIDVRLPKSLGALEGCQVIIEDIDAAIEATMPQSSVAQEARDQVAFTSKNNGDFFFQEFRDLETIYTWYELLERTFPQLVKVETVGETWEGRPLHALHISTNNPDTNPEKKTIVITGGVHAREWISVTSACWTVHRLLTSYGKHNRETKYLDSLDFLIIPVFNPDGYAYTWQHDRLWRKNRQETYWPNCPGIDIDHSFDFQWKRSDEVPCTEDYSGEEAFEAIEAHSWNHFLNTTKLQYKIHGYLDFHSYSQEVLYPYAYSCDALPRDLENLLELSYGLAKAIRNKSGKHYKVLSACEDRGSDLAPGLGSGSSLDFMYHMRAHWAFQLKLRDTGNMGFLLPPRYIEPVGKEIYAAVSYFCSFILNPEL